MKTNLFNIVLVLSLLLNLITVLGITTFIYKKGGYQYITSKIRPNTVPVNSYQLDRRTIFDVLPKQEGAVVFLGDSLTNNNEWQDFFVEQSIQNRGISGETSADILNRIDVICEEKPSKIFIMVGTNDISQGKSAADIIGNYNKIIDEIKTKSPTTKIYIQSILPINKKLLKGTDEYNKIIIETNEGLELLAAEQQIIFIDIHNKLILNGELDPKYTHDGIHLNGEAYTIWVDQIKEFVEKND